MPVALQNDATCVVYIHSDDYTKHTSKCNLKAQELLVTGNVLETRGMTKQHFKLSGERISLWLFTLHHDVRTAIKNCRLSSVHNYQNNNVRNMGVERCRFKGTFLPWVQAPLAHAWAPNLPTQDVLLMLCLSVEHRGKAGLV
jgi:hypothetical protein